MTPKAMRDAANGPWEAPSPTIHRVVYTHHGDHVEAHAQCGQLPDADNWLALDPMVTCAQCLFPLAA